MKEVTQLQVKVHKSRYVSLYDGSILIPTLPLKSLGTRLVCLLILIHEPLYSGVRVFKEYTVDTFMFRHLPTNKYPWHYCTFTRKCVGHRGVPFIPISWFAYTLPQ